MRWFKRLLAVVLVISVVFSVTACSDSVKKISAEEFKLKLQEHSFVVIEADTKTEGILSSYIAYPDENQKSVTVTYSVFENEEDARMSFNTTKHSFEKAKKSGDYTELIIGDHKFTAKKGSEYVVITVYCDDMIIKAAGTNEEKVTDAMRILGY
ncbi:MAG: hypothetical protein J5750_02035 [Clostridiales bacterium]|nr:hypothetical protein [Clostridiales bacterium]